MRLSRHKATEGLTINMTPMIDVVFLLLIFFMTVSEISKTNNEPLELPKVKGGADATEGTLTINILATEGISISGEERSLTEAIAIAQQLVDERGADNVEVVMRVHKSARCRTLNQLVSALPGLGIGKFSFRVEDNQ